jgi:hypothetical protein
VGEHAGGTDGGSSAGLAGAFSGSLASDARTYPVAVVRLALRPGGRHRKGGEVPLRALFRVPKIIEE